MLLPPSLLLLASIANTLHPKKKKKIYEKGFYLIKQLNLRALENA